MQTPKYLKQSLILLSVGVAVGVLFILFFIIPSHKQIANLDNAIGMAKLKIETQEKLGPLYKGLNDKLKKIDTRTSMVNKQPLSKMQINSVSNVVSGMARKTNLSLVSFYPETTADSASALYYISLRGNFIDFRNFLKEIGSLPYVDSVQEIKVNTGKGSREFNVKVKLLVA